jgi:hypothetical protein
MAESLALLSCKCSRPLQVPVRGSQAMQPAEAHLPRKSMNVDCDSQRVVFIVGLKLERDSSSAVKGVLPGVWKCVIRET